MKGIPSFGRSRVPLVEPFAKALRHLVRTQGIEGAADTLGSSRTTIEKLVSGGTVMPTTAQQIAARLDELEQP